MMARKKNKFDIIFANGCSYVQGSALNGKKLPSEPVENVKNRFSELVSKKAKAKEVNIAAGGAGNDKIFRTTFEYFEENKEELQGKNILVCLGITFCVRKEMFLNSTQNYTKTNFYGPYHISGDLFKQSRYFSVNEGRQFQKLYFQEFFNEKEHARSSYRGLRCLIDYLNNNFNVTIYMFNSLEQYLPDYYKEGLDIDDKYEPTWSIWIPNNNLTLSDCNHPLEDAHKEMADHIISKYNI